MPRTRAATLVLGTLAVAAGCAFLWDVGALPGMVTRNAGAYLLGLSLGGASHRVALLRHGAVALFAIAALVLGWVFVGGITLDGVTRWLAVGPLNLQPALILAPLLLAIVAANEGRHWRAAILVPIGLIAAQPDAATSLAMAAGVAALMASASHESRRGWSRRRILLAGGALGLAALGLLLAGFKTPPPVAFVEGTIGISLLSGTPAMLLHLAAIGLAVTALAWRRDSSGAALAAYFATAAFAAIFWAYPMPVVGAGPSHLIGFGLAVGWLASRPQGHEPPRTGSA